MTQLEVIFFFKKRALGLHSHVSSHLGCVQEVEITLCSGSLVDLNFYQLKSKLVACCSLSETYNHWTTKLKNGPIRKLKVKKARKWACVKNRLMSPSLVKLCYVFWANSSMFCLLYRSFSSWVFVHHHFFAITRLKIKNLSDKESFFSGEAVSAAELYRSAGHLARLPLRVHYLSGA